MRCPLLSRAGVSGGSVSGLGRVSGGDFSRRRGGAHVHVCGVWDVDQRRGVTTGSEIGPAVVGLFARTATTPVGWPVSGPDQGGRVTLTKRGCIGSMSQLPGHVDARLSCLGRWLARVVSGHCCHAQGCSETPLPEDPSTTRLGGMPIELTVLSASRQAVRAVRRRGRSHRHLALGPKLVDRQHWAAALSMPWLFSSLRPEIWPSRRRAAPQGE